jgi:hypothetical protein
MQSLQLEAAGNALMDEVLEFLSEHAQTVKNMMELSAIPTVIMVTMELALSAGNNVPLVRSLVALSVLTA